MSAAMRSRGHRFQPAVARRNPEATCHVVPEESFYQAMFITAPHLILWDLPWVIRSRAHFDPMVDQEQSRRLLAAMKPLLRA